MDPLFQSGREDKIIKNWEKILIFFKQANIEWTHALKIKKYDKNSKKKIFEKQNSKKDLKKSKCDSEVVCVHSFIHSFIHSWGARPKMKKMK